MKRVPKYDVVCPHCCGIFHETTADFERTRSAKGHMFRLKPHFADMGWGSFPPYESTEYDNLTCPACEQPYVDAIGRVLRLQEVGVYEVLEEDELKRIEMERLMAEYEPDVPGVNLRESAPGTAYAEVAELAKQGPPKKTGRPRKVKT